MAQSRQAEKKIKVCIDSSDIKINKFQLFSISI